MKCLFAAPFFLVSILAVGQTVTVKSSPAVDALNHAAQDLATEQKSFDAILNQARSSMDASNKQLQDKLQELNKALLDQLKADKKYKDQLAAIDAVQKQLSGLNADASQKFNAQVAPIQNEIGKDKALIDGLIPVVRKENNLPDAATFDSVSQKWTAPKVADPKK